MALAFRERADSIREFERLCKVTESETTFELSYPAALHYLPVRDLTFPRCDLILGSEGRILAASNTGHLMKVCHFAGREHPTVGLRRAAATEANQEDGYGASPILLKRSTNRISERSPASSGATFNLTSHSSRVS